MGGGRAEEGLVVAQTASVVLPRPHPSPPPPPSLPTSSNSKSSSTATSPTSGSRAPHATNHANNNNQPVASSPFPALAQAPTELTAATFSVISFRQPFLRMMKRRPRWRVRRAAVETVVVTVVTIVVGRGG